ncbi:MAG: LysM peptidoglycan-binding domain-containing protein, partial [Candidatus Hydrogenedentes bacterium]|nr:LysM peptidoglycan-binding domain-containing protein [Candidatus Hydrogenedentota bacterium]
MITRRRSLTAWSAAILFGVAGCVSTKSNHDVHQFAPVPTAKVGTQELKPAKSTATLDLLKTADECFRKGNALQEKGDKEGALKEYNRFLELLIEADLDPGVFYNLRSEFGRVLNSTNQQARLFERSKRAKMTPEELAQANISGDLEFDFNDRVQTEILEIQNYYPKNFQGGLNRSGKYLPYIQNEFAKAGLPASLAWLAMVESQFTPKINSRAGAGGMWQFMKETGRRYNLRIDNYVDERYNWKKSTQAAIQYLRDMNERFGGNWPVTVAAYNMGEFGMERAIASNGGNADLWQLIETPPASNHMMDETKKFYPKLRASIIVASNPEKFGFEGSTQEPDDCVEVPVKGSFSLAVLDRACGLPEGTLSSLNQDLIRGVTPPDREHELTVPTPARDKLIEALASVPQDRSGGRFNPISSTVNKISSLNPIGKRGITQHMVRRGETLSGIADQYDIPVSDLMKANNLRAGSQLPVGRRLNIPRAAPSARADIPAPAADPSSGHEEASTPSETAKASSRTYTVKQGDTLFDIAKLEGMPLKDLLRLNDLGDGASIHVGDKLVLKGAPEPPAPTKTSYTVKKGDTPASIAKRHNVSLDDLVKWNKLGKSPTVILGQNLVVYERGAAPAERKELAKAETAKPAPKAADAAAPEKKTVTGAVAKAPAPKNTEKVAHTVAKGETATAIAAKYSVDLNALLAWNGMTQESVVKVGDQLAVYVAKKAESAPAPKAAEAKKADAAKPAPAAAKGDAASAHTVAKGENPSTIARRYNVSVSDLSK